MGDLFPCFQEYKGGSECPSYTSCFLTNFIQNIHYDEVAYFGWHILLPSSVLFQKTMCFIDIPKILQIRLKLFRLLILKP